MNTIARLDIVGASGFRTRILTHRRKVHGLYVDLDVLIVQQVAPGTELIVVKDGPMDDVPRAYGVDGVYAILLARISTAADVYDDEGNVIPMPELTADEWRERAAALRDQADEAEAIARGGIPMRPSAPKGGEA